MTVRTAQPIGTHGVSTTIADERWPDPPPVIPYQFHHRVHEDWGEQSLHFWFFAFRASCDPEELREALGGVLDKHRVTAHASYELMGQYDLMLRVWLPVARVNSFRVSIREAFDPLSLSLAAHFTVEEHIRHWPWASRSAQRGPIRQVKDDRLAEKPRDTDLRALNRLTRPRGGTLRPEFSSFEVANLITEAPPGNDGVKLVTLVTPIGHVSVQKRAALAKLLARVLDDSDPEIFSECSLYSSDGESALFLIMCRIKSTRYAELRPKLFDPLQLPLLGEARTTTYTVVASEFLPVVDAIPLRPPVSGGRSTSNITELLRSDESHTLEVKATAFAPIDPWLREGKPLEESAQFFNRGILKSIAAFLNSDRGGTLIVGALEAERYRDLSPSLDERLNEFPAIGQYICCGLVDPTFTNSGWDKFERRILDTLERRLSPAPLGRVRLARRHYGDEDLCVIQVDPWDDEEWTYAQASEAQPAAFYTRDGARVVERQGLEADQYKKRRDASRRGRRR